VVVGVIAAEGRAMGGEKGGVINAALYVRTAACCLRAITAACFLARFSTSTSVDTVANAALCVTSAKGGSVSTTRPSASSKHSWYVRFGPATCYVLTPSTHT